MIVDVVNESVAWQRIWMALYFLRVIGLALAAPGTMIEYSWERKSTKFAKC